MDKNILPPIIASLIVSIIVTLTGTYFLVKLPKIEELGGFDNYKLYSKVLKSDKYKASVKENLEAQLSGKAPEQQAEAPEEKTAGTLSQDEVQKVMKDAHIKGDASADIVWVEYSDLECPFCKRLHDSKAISNLETKYGSKLALSFKHYPLPFHPLAGPAAQAAECVAELGGDNKYFAFVDGVFTKGAPTQEIMDATLTEIGVKKDKVKTCVDSGKYKSRVDADMTEGSGMFGVNGTPGNVLINTKTGNYEVVSGAHPESSFDAAITRLLGQ